MGGKKGRRIFWGYSAVKSLLLFVFTINVEYPSWLDRKLSLVHLASLFNLLFNSARRDEIRRYTGLNNHEPDEKEMELTNLLKILWADSGLFSFFPFLAMMPRQSHRSFHRPCTIFVTPVLFLWTKDGRLLSASLSFRPLILFFPLLLFVPISWCLCFFTIHQILCDPDYFFSFSFSFYTYVWMCEEEREEEK